MNRRRLERLQLVAIKKEMKLIKQLEQGEAANFKQMRSVVAQNHQIVTSGLKKMQTVQKIKSTTQQAAEDQRPKLNAEDHADLDTLFKEESSDYVDAYNDDRPAYSVLIKIMTSFVQV